MTIDSVNIGFEPMERFKELFFDPCPKARIPEVLNCLPADQRTAFETWLKEQAEIALENGGTPLNYDPIPCVADAYVFFENEQRATWSAVVDRAGRLKCLIDPHGSRYHSMEELHDHHVTHFTLEFEHTVAVVTNQAGGES